MAYTLRDIIKQRTGEVATSNVNSPFNIMVSINDNSPVNLILSEDELKELGWILEKKRGTYAHCQMNTSINNKFDFYNQVNAGYFVWYDKFYPGLVKLNILTVINVCATKLQFLNSRNIEKFETVFKQIEENGVKKQLDINILKINNLPTDFINGSNLMQIDFNGNYSGLERANVRVSFEKFTGGLNSKFRDLTSFTQNDVINNELSIDNINSYVDWLAPVKNNNSRNINDTQIISTWFSGKNTDLNLNFSKNPNSISGSYGNVVALSRKFLDIDSNDYYGSYIESDFASTLQNASITYNAPGGYLWLLKGAISSINLTRCHIKADNIVLDDINTRSGDYCSSSLKRSAEEQYNKIEGKYSDGDNVRLNGGPILSDTNMDIIELDGNVIISGGDKFNCAFFMRALQAKSIGVLRITGGIAIDDTNQKSLRAASWIKKTAFESLDLSHFALLKVNTLEISSKFKDINLKRLINIAAYMHRQDPKQIELINSPFFFKKIRFINDGGEFNKNHPRVLELKEAFKTVFHHDVEFE